MGTITIVNRHFYTGNHVYCGRGSPLGNRYSHLRKSTALFKAKTREEAIELGTVDIYDRLIKGEKDLVDAIANLIIRYQRNDDIVLGCYCTPEPCHLDMIKQGVETDEFLMIDHVSQRVTDLMSNS